MSLNFNGILITLVIIKRWSEATDLDICLNSCTNNSYRDAPSNFILFHLSNRISPYQIHLRDWPKITCVYFADRNFLFMNHSLDSPRKLLNKLIISITLPNVIVLRSHSKLINNRYQPSPVNQTTILVEDHKTMKRRFLSSTIWLDQHFSLFLWIPFFVKCNPYVIQIMEPLN